MRLKTLQVATIIGMLVMGCAPTPMSTPPAVELACTSFCLDNGGHAVFGSNYDNAIWEGSVFVNPRGVEKSGWEAGTSGKIAYWTSEYTSVTFNLAGSQMAWAGMNEAGLVLSTMWLRQTQDPSPDERPPLVSPLWMQYQLDTGATVQEVVANEDHVRITGTVDHYLVCDRSATCAAVEFLEEGAVFHTGDAMPIKTLTNHGYPQAVAAWRASRLTDNSLERFGIAADRVLAFQATDASEAVEYAFETLHQARMTPEQGSPTQWSIVFDTENRRVHFHTSRNAHVRTVDLARLDLDCASPRGMLDVHAPVSGDISGQFEDYSFEVNLRTTREFLDKYGWDISPLEVEILERGLASFGCQRSIAPRQEERKPLIPVLAQWAALALVYRFWYVGLVLLVGIAALVVWRVRARQGT